MNVSKHMLADSVASIVVLSVAGFILLSMLGVFGATFNNVGATWFGLYAFVVLMSSTKLYGKSVYDAVKGIGKGLIGQRDRQRPRQTTNDSNN